MGSICGTPAAIYRHSIISGEGTVSVELRLTCRTCCLVLSLALCHAVSAHTKTLLQHNVERFRKLTDLA
ncbi:hypothetical protein M758_7G120300 [Ceratodon purpureus]|nr:hypothetical protein M758_7G120300 [Ceratodon purpureus]